MRKPKIAVTKKAMVKPIAQVRVGAIKRPNKTINIKPTKKITSTPKSVVSTPKTVILPTPKKRQSQSLKEIDRARVQKTIESVKQGKKRIIRLNNKIRKDANYHKISEIRNTGINRILIMIACGPSVLENDFSLLNNVEHIDIMVINKPLESVWPPKYWAFCDQSQYRRNQNYFNSYGGLLINSSAVLARRQNQIIITAKGTTGISRNLQEGYVIGRSSVYANIQVALWMNYSKIFIFGVDMCSVNGKVHHYGVNPDVNEQKRLERFKGEAGNYEIMASKLPEELRKKIYFCSEYNPWPFIDKFNRWSHKDAIARILDIAKRI